MANEVKIVVSATNKAKSPVQDATRDVEKLGKAVQKVPDKKTIKINADGSEATKEVDKVDKKKVSDKETKITADDQASEKIDAIAKKKKVDVKAVVTADVKEVNKGLKDVGGKGAEAFLGGFSGGLAGGGLADMVGGFVSDVISKAGDRQKVAANLQNMMGISPDAAKTYGDRVGAMFWGGLGDSKDQIAGAFGSLSSDVKGWGNLTVEQQDRVVKGAVKISSAFKTDISEPIQAASSMVQNKLVGSYEEAFDLITGGYQTLGSRADDALDTLQEYSGYFQKLGFDGPHALKMINDMMQAGARDTDYAADAWKEFQLKMRAGADDTVKALKDLGLNAKQTLSDINSGGPKAQEAIGKVLDKLQAVKDPAKQDEIGRGLFGTKWEDSLQLVINGIDIAKGKVEDFKGATDGLTDSAVSEMDKLQRKLDETSSKFGESTATMINHNHDFMDSQNTAIGSLFGFGDGVQAQTDHMNNYGFGIDGVNNKVIGLADSLGGPGSEAFGRMILKMSDTDLAVLGVKATMDTLAGRVYTLPDGHKITIDTNTGKVTGDVQALHREVDALPTGSKFFHYFVETITTNKTYNMAPIPMGPSHAAGGAAAGHAAEGGARGRVTRVNEQGPELLRDQRGVLRDLQDGSQVIPAGQSAQIMAAAAGGRSGGGGSGGPVTINLMLDRTVLQTVTVDLTRDYIRNRGGDAARVLGSR